MRFEFKKGQRIRVIPVENKDWHLRYPELKKYINSVGTIISVPPEFPHKLDVEEIPEENSFIYEVLMDEDKRRIMVLQEALETYPIDQ